MTTANGHIWIDGIDHDPTSGWTLRLLRQNGNGFCYSRYPVASIHRLPALDTGGPFFSWIPRTIVDVCVPDLRRLETVVDAQDVVGMVHRSLRVSSDHALFKYDAAVPVYIPSFLLTQILFMGTQTLDRALFVPQGCEWLAMARTAGAAVELDVLNSLIRSQLTGRVVRMLAWILGTADGRRCHASVLESARAGKLGLVLPNASLRSQIRCIELDHGVLAFELMMADLRLNVPWRDITVRLKNTRWTIDAYESPMPGPGNPRFADEVARRRRKTTTT